MKTVGHKDDSTFEYKLIDFFTNQWQTLATLVILAIVISGGIVSYRYFERSKEKQAQEQLYVLQKALKDKTKEIDQTAAKVPAQTKTPETLVKNYGDILPKFTTFIGDHEGRKAAYMAAIQVASLAVDYKDFARAENILKMVINMPSRHDVFWDLVNGQYTGVLIQEGKCEQAIPILKEIANSKPHAFFQAHALLRLGACYIKTKSYNKAEDAFVRIQTDFPQSEAALEARDLKRLILIRRGQKS